MRLGDKIPRISNPRPRRCLLSLLRSTCTLISRDISEWLSCPMSMSRHLGTSKRGLRFGVGFVSGRAEPISLGFQMAQAPTCHDFLSICKQRANWVTPTEYFISTHPAGNEAAEPWSRLSGIRLGHGPLRISGLSARGLSAAALVDNTEYYNNILLPMKMQRGIKTS